MNRAFCPRSPRSPEFPCPRRHQTFHPARNERRSFAEFSLGQPAFRPPTTFRSRLPLILQWDENFDVGADTGTPVEEQGLSGAVPVYRQAYEAHADDRPAEAHPRRREAPDGSAAQQQDERVAASVDRGRGRPIAALGKQAKGAGMSERVRGCGGIGSATPPAI